MEILDLNKVETLVVKTDKFKTITFLISLYGEFNKENATKRSLLTRVMSNSTKNYPTKKSLTNHLFDLYDLNVSISNTSIHEVSITNFIFEVIHPKYVEDKMYMNNVFEFIREIIFNPNIKDNGFDESVFNEEKKILSENIKNVYNNKPYFALKRLFQTMCEGEISSISNLGTLEDLELITKENLYQFYLETLKTEQPKIHVIGMVDDINLEENILNLGFNNVNLNLNFCNNETVLVKEVKEIIEYQKINQSQLMIGYRTNINYLHPLYIPSLVLKMMLGGMASSDLFKIVREENSFAYNVHAQLYSADKVLVINAGIDSSNYKLAKKLIIEQINKYKVGKIRKTLLKSAKENLISSIYESFDDTVSTLLFYSKNRLLNIYNVEEFISKIKNVTIEDITQVSKLLELDTIYMLAGEDNA